VNEHRAGLVTCQSVGSDLWVNSYFKPGGGTTMRQFFVDSLGGAHNDAKIMLGFFAATVLFG